MIRTTVCVRGAILAMGCAIAFALVPQAHAITITVNSITKNAGDTANFSQNNSGNAGEWQSAVSVLSSGANTPDVIGASVSASTRYAAVLGSDSNALNFASRSDNSNSNYSVTFTVSPQFAPPHGTVYSVNIVTARRGALVVREEGGAAGGADISAVTGSIVGGTGVGTLGLADVAGVSANATTVTQINQTSTGYLISGLTGVHVFTLNFTWNQSTTSGNNAISGGDEGAVLLGWGTTGPAALIGAADDYPGTAGRSPFSNDGHFVNITASIQLVPEPGTLALAVLGALVLGLTAINRRRIG